MHFSKSKQPLQFSSVVSVKTPGASKRDTEIWTVVPILQDVTETKPNKILFPPFYYYEETFYSWVLYKLKDFKWKEGLGIKLTKGSSDHHEDQKLSLFF